MKCISKECILTEKKLQKELKYFNMLLKENSMKWKKKGM